MTAVTQEEASGEALTSGLYAASCPDGKSPPEALPYLHDFNSFRFKSDWTSVTQSGILPDGRQPGEVTALKAAVALGDLLAQCRSVMRVRQLEIAAATWRLERTFAPAAMRIPGGSGAELIAGSRNVRRLLAAISDLPVVSRLALLDEPVPAGGAASLRASSALAERGVAMRAVYRQEARLSAEQRLHLRLLASAGVQARQVPLIPVNMIIIDDATVVLPADPDQPAAGVVVTRNTAWAYLARLVFDDCWDRAEALSR